MKPKIPTYLAFAGALLVTSWLSVVPTLAQGDNPPGQGIPKVLEGLSELQEQLAFQQEALVELVAALISTGKEPINLSGSATIDAGGNSSFIDVFEVPSDRFLVIEYVSFRAFAGVSQDRLVSLRVLTTAGGNRIDHRISPAPIKSSEVPEQQGGSKVKLYADPGTTLTFIAERGCCGDSPTAVAVSFSGYLTRQPRSSIRSGRATAVRFRAFSQLRRSPRGREKPSIVVYKRAAARQKRAKFAITVNEKRRPAEPRTSISQ
jgi:hypothetical protein